MQTVYFYDDAAAEADKDDDGRFANLFQDKADCLADTEMHSGFTMMRTGNSEVIPSSQSQLKLQAT